MILPLGQKSSVALFTDGGSLGHLLAGLLAGMMPEPYSLGIFALFAGYQLSQVPTGVPWVRTGGEFVEFGLGAAASALLRRAM